MKSKMKMALVLLPSLLLVAVIVYTIALQNRNAGINAFFAEALEATEQELAAARSEISDLGNVIEDYSHRLWQEQARLDDALREDAGLRREIERLEQTVDSLHNPQRSYWDAQHVRLDDGRYLRYAGHYIHILDYAYQWYAATIVYDHDLDGWFFATRPSLSPNGNLLVYTLTWGEDWGGFVYIYDMNTGENRHVDLYVHPYFGGNTQFGPADAAWLDDRTLLVMVRHIHSRPKRGGRLFAYDIHDKTLTSMDIAALNESDLRRQIWTVRVSGGVVYMDILEDITGSAQRFNIFPHSISVAEAHRLIAEGETRSAGRP